MTRKQRIAALGAVIVLGALAAVAIARPGGGNSYSGGGGHSSSSSSSSSSSGGSSSGGGGIGALIDLIRLLWYLVELCVYHPFIGIPIVVGVIGLISYSKYKDWRDKDWNSGPPVELGRTIRLDALRQTDPAFSEPVFEDFVYRLYAAAHLAKHDPNQLAGLAPYISDGMRDTLARRIPNDIPITAVIVGAQRVIALETRTPKHAITIEFEANLATAKATHFVVDRWTFIRDPNVKTKPPSRVRIRRCPNCDAPWAAKDTGSSVCASCGQPTDAGRFDWFVQNIEIRSVQSRVASLTEDVREYGTDLPTYTAPDAPAILGSIQTADPQTDEHALIARIKLIYAQVYAAWAKNELAPARGLLTDGLYDYLNYWIVAYKRDGLRNELVDMQVTDTELAKASRDQYYDAVTFRIWATGKDYVIKEQTREIVKGSSSKNRPYSEYWTLIRAAGKTGAPGKELKCPNCNGALQINQSGECEFCATHVTAGEFDWVLSKIEQDDSYRG